jgi:uncharacterized protein YgiM (DUF1202 family)
MKILSLSAILLLFLTQSYGQDHKFVKSEILNIRESAGKQYKLLGQLKKGDRVVVISDSIGWTKIQSEQGITGYVASNHLESESKLSVPSESKSDGSNWVSALIILGIVIYTGYKVKNIFSGIFGGSSSSSNSRRETTRKSYDSPKQTDTFHLSIKDGVVNLGKERSTMRQPVFTYFDKAIDCDLEDPKDDRSRFLVVTAKGEVMLCKLKSTGKTFVFRPFVSYGSAYKAQFADSNSFIFTTEKGTYKGYFNSTRKDKLS